MLGEKPSHSFAKTRTDKNLVFVTLIPKGRTYQPGQFNQIINRYISK